MEVKLKELYMQETLCDLAQKETKKKVMQKMREYRKISEQKRAVFYLENLEKA